MKYKCRNCGELYDDTTFKALYKGYCSNQCLNTMVYRIRRNDPEYWQDELGVVLVLSGEIGHVSVPPGT